MENEIFSVRWQVLHSKVCCSNPRSPGEIRANPILCLQVGHIGRSVMELRIAHRPSRMIGVQTDAGLSGVRLSEKFCRRQLGASRSRGVPASAFLQNILDLSDRPLLVLRAYPDARSVVGTN
jgi:hypothetical protein